MNRLKRANLDLAEANQALIEAGYLSVLIPEAYGGSGLGLAIAAEVANAHRGALSFARDSDLTRVRLLLGL